jgi:hypothetical protein
MFETLQKLYGSARHLGLISVAGLLFTVLSPVRTAAAASAGCVSPLDSPGFSGLETPEQLAYRFPLSRFVSLLQIPAERMEQRAGIIPAQSMKLAATRWKDSEPKQPRVWPDGSQYAPRITPSESQRAAYAEASTAYYARQYDAALRSFDAIAGDRQSPYRGAAAYSAARASLMAGDIDNGIDRIHALQLDPDKQEFHAAARRLIGTLAYKSDFSDKRLLAAAYVQSVYMLAAVAASKCFDETASDVAAESLEVLSWYVDFYQSGLGSPGKERVLDGLAEDLPPFDLIRALAIPGPFDTPSLSWPLATADGKGSYEFDPIHPVGRWGIQQGLEEWSSLPGLELTKNARSQWSGTGNLLWGLILARRSVDEADVPAVLSMMPRLPDAGSKDAKLTDRATGLWLLTQAIRIHVQNGNTRSALDLLRKNKVLLGDPDPRIGYLANFTTSDWKLSRLKQDAVYSAYFFLLNQYKFAEAHRWLLDCDRVLGPGTSSPVSTLASGDKAPFLSSLGLLKVASGYVTTAPAFTPASQLLDFVSAEDARQIQASPFASIALRRALLSSQLTRSLSLGDFPEGLRTLRQMQDSFPEHREVIQAILSAKKRDQAFQLATFLIANPGLGIYPSRMLADELQSPARSSGQLDAYNANDSNWWCRFNYRRELADSGNSFLNMSESGVRSRSFWWPARPAPNMAWKEMQSTDEAVNRYWADEIAVKDQYVSLGEELLKSHPLLGPDATRDAAKLATGRSATEVLSAAVFEWADATTGKRTADQNEQLARALSGIVRMTRYGCRRDSATGEISREAYIRLHDEFPRSASAARTPYWFDFGPRDAHDQTKRDVIGLQ